jgi:hypothetical protein
VQLEDVPREWLLGGVAVSAGYALLAAARGWLARLALRRRFARAAEGERTAAVLLQSAGYAVERAQVSRTYALSMNGEEVVIEVRADYVVRRGSARYVAEVKTGKVAPSIQHAPTRRQLLEYRYAFDVDGVLLVDAEARRVHRIDFRGRDKRSFMSWLFS